MTPLQRPERCQILRRTEFDNEQGSDLLVLALRHHSFRAGVVRS